MDKLTLFANGIILQERPGDCDPAVEGLELLLLNVMGVDYNDTRFKRISDLGARKY
jgi:hypothetical protein